MMKIVCMVPSFEEPTLARRTGEESGDMIAQAHRRALVAGFGTPLRPTFVARPFGVRLAVRPFGARLAVGPFGAW
ncbi:MAG: hypothetical protein ACREUF_19045, partial [Solimonas sp.]